MSEISQDDPKPLPRSEAPLPSDAGVIVHRSPEIGDVHFITNSWNKSYRKAKSHMADTDYYAGQDRLIYNLSPRSDIIIACDEKDSFYIYGWICGKFDADTNRLLLHYVYVKHAYRRRGIATGLLRQLGYNPSTAIIATHWTQICAEVAKNYKTSYNDYHLKLGA